MNLRATSLHTAAPGHACATGPFEVPAAVRLGIVDPAAARTLACALTRAFDGTADSAVPVIVALTEYARASADRFTGRHDDPGHRMRPSDSTGLEPSGVLQPFLTASGWQGRCHLVTSRDDAAGQALRWATALVGAGRAPSVVVCDLPRDEHGAYWAVAVRLWGGAAAPPAAPTDRATSRAPDPCAPDSGAPDLWAADPWAADPWTSDPWTPNPWAADSCTPDAIPPDSALTTFATAAGAPAALGAVPHRTTRTTPTTRTTRTTLTTKEAGHG
ncbi:hypothetical protein ACIRST_20495 [Kitasatospora sp. NPDC101447]|uniref:hypothetical protein n=1 Tax=Kitasatospora sp. NPDC101447 TaxID=3364102 RepID=UPI003809AFE7